MKEKKKKHRNPNCMEKGDTHKPKAAAKEETFGDGQVKSFGVAPILQEPSNIDICI